MRSEKMNKLDGLKKQMNFLIETAYKKGYEAEQMEAKPKETKAFNNGYEIGLKKAWECARKIHSLGNNLFREGLFGKGYGLSYRVIDKFPVTEAIARIKEYEEQQKEEKQTDDEIKVGDEIYSEVTESKAIVLYIDCWGDWHCLLDDGITELTEEYKKYWTKTGRHFPQIAEVVEQVRR